MIGSYVAVGDSFTEGVGDPGPDGRFVGWADRFAVLLADRVPEGDFGYTNLAVRGKLLDQIVADQVPRALELAPDLISFCAGGNDIIRPGTDPDEVAERFERAVSRLTSAVGTVMVTTGFDTRDVPVLRHMRGKIATYNLHVRAIADRYGCPVLDLWSLKTVQDRRAWDLDRLHLSPEGHTRVALRAGQVLGVDIPADPDQPWPPLPPRGTLEMRRDNIHWAREYLVPWIGRRLRGSRPGIMCRRRGSCRRTTSGRGSGRWPERPERSERPDGIASGGRPVRSGRPRAWGWPGPPGAVGACLSWGCCAACGCGRRVVARAVPHAPFGARGPGGWGAVLRAYCSARRVLRTGTAPSAGRLLPPSAASAVGRFRRRAASRRRGGACSVGGGSFSGSPL